HSIPLSYTFSFSAPPTRSSPKEHKASVSSMPNPHLLMLDLVPLSLLFAEFYIACWVACVGVPTSSDTRESGGPPMSCLEGGARWRRSDERSVGRRTMGLRRARIMVARAFARRAGLCDNGLLNGDEAP
ncbi:unnamed protein product, partial [Urochloa humidicola]